MDNIMFVPGWMRNGLCQKDYNSLEIWQTQLDASKIQADVLIGYSGAAFFCLNYWQTHKDTKLILVNPLLGKKIFTGWIVKWLKTALTEGFKNFGDILPKKYLWLNLKKFRQFSKVDAMQIIANIPKDKLVILKGEKDIFCDSKIFNSLKNQGYQTVKLSGEGHNWSEKFSLEVKKYL